MPSKKDYQLLAETELESGNLSAAYKNFLEADLLTQAAFVLLLDQKIDEAKKQYEEAPDSIAKTWGVFLCQYLGAYPGQVDIPGFLSFRLFFESTFFYFLKFNINHYLDKIFADLTKLELYYPECRKFIGSAYLSLGDYSKAENFLREALEVLPQDAECIYKLGEIYFLKKDYLEAKTCFESVLKILPGHKSSLLYLEKIQDSF